MEIPRQPKFLSSAWYTVNPLKKKIDDVERKPPLTNQKMRPSFFFFFKVDFKTKYTVWSHFGKKITFICDWAVKNGTCPEIHSLLPQLLGEDHWAWRSCSCPTGLSLFAEQSLFAQGLWTTVRVRCIVVGVGPLVCGKLWLFSYCLFKGHRAAGEGCVAEH